MHLSNLICLNDNSVMNWALAVPHVPFPHPASASSSPQQPVVSAPPSSAVPPPFSDAPLFGARLVAWLYAPAPWSETLAKLARNTAYAACVHGQSVHAGVKPVVSAPCCYTCKHALAISSSTQGWNWIIYCSCELLNILLALKQRGFFFFATFDTAIGVMDLK